VNSIHTDTILNNYNKLSDKRFRIEENSSYSICYGEYVDYEKNSSIKVEIRIYKSDDYKQNIKENGFIKQNDVYIKGKMIQSNWYYIHNKFERKYIRRIEIIKDNVYFYFVEDSKSASSEILLNTIQNVMNEIK
jgi:hypothetical protein